MDEKALKRTLRDALQEEEVLVEGSPTKENATAIWKLRRTVVSHLRHLSKEQLAFVLPKRRELPPSLLQADEYRILCWGRFQHNESINALEARTALMALQHAADNMDNTPKVGVGRFMCFVDNTASVGALEKGRSSRFDILRICQKTAALSVATNAYCRWRYAGTAVSPCGAPYRSPRHSTSAQF